VVFPAAVLGRAVAIGQVHGPAAGLRETDRLREVLGDRHRWRPSGAGTLAREQSSR
jgi:predicted RNA polymerase sigma factor